MNKYPFLRIEDLIDQLQGEAIFSKIDLRSRYHQLKIKIGNISNTPFRTRYGHYKFFSFAIHELDEPDFHDFLDRLFIAFIDSFKDHTENLEE